MRAIKKARRWIEQDPQSVKAKALSKLILSLENEEDSPLKELYNLPLEEFDLAIQVLQDWRLDRYYVGKSKAFSAALQADEFNTPSKSS